MQIDWTQTLLGSDAEMTADEAGLRDGSLRAQSIILAGRMAGMLGAVLLLATTVALTPVALFGGKGLEALTAMAGVLVLQVVGFASVRRYQREALPLLAAGGFVQLLLMIGLGAPLPGVCAAFLVIGGEFAALWLLACRAQPRMAGYALILGLCAAATGLFILFPQVASAALLGAMAIPAMAMLPLVMAEAARKPSSPVQPEVIPGLIDIVLSALPGQVLVVDTVGTVEPLQTPSRFAQTLRAASRPMTSLTEALLVVDRPLVLQALSRAIHDRVASDAVPVRLMDQSQDCLSPAYLPHRMAIRPLPGLEGRALVLITPDAGQAEPAPLSAKVDQALIQRAMHDAISPFNAGLGYLELMSDPKLAPRDLASFRHYATEARGAMVEAHRNTALMGRWLKLVTGAAVPMPERLDLTKLAGDAVRMLSSADEQSAPVHVDAPEGGVMVDMPADAARFALGTLLRSLVRLPQAKGGIRLSIRASGTDVLLVARLTSGERVEQAGEDVFQLALEQAAMRLLPARFSDGPGERRLVLTGIGVAPLLRRMPQAVSEGFGEKWAS